MRLQDAHACFTPVPDTLVAIACDGAGSAAMGGEGASLTVRTMSQALRQHYRQSRELPDAIFFSRALDRTRDLLFVVAERRGLPRREFACTLVCAVADTRGTVIAHVGDGCAVIRPLETGQWCAPLWPEHGEHASTTRFVTEDPAPALRVEASATPVSALAVFSDGLERLALDFMVQTPFQPFFRNMVRPLETASSHGRQATLSNQLATYLDSPSINARTDDDKTLVIAVQG